MSAWTEYRCCPHESAIPRSLITIVNAPRASHSARTADDCRFTESDRHERENGRSARSRPRGPDWAGMRISTGAGYEEAVWPMRPSGRIRRLRPSCHFATDSRPTRTARSPCRQAVELPLPHVVDGVVKK